MKVSVITVAFNAATTIRRTIESVAGQNFTDLEYIVVDGLSTDGTQSIVRSFGEVVSEFVSEKDRGPYDAMNKGIARSTGDIVAILNSDDEYVDSNVITDVARAFRTQNCQMIYADIVIVSPHDRSRVVRRWRPGEYRRGSFANGWHPPHPGFFVKKQIYEDCGMFDTSFDISADFELMLRLFERCRISSQYLPRTVARMSAGGLSNGSLRNVIIGNRNCIRAFRKNRLPVPFLYPVRRLVPKIGQFFSSETKNERG